MCTTRKVTMGHQLKNSALKQKVMFVCTKPCRVAAFATSTLQLKYNEI